MGGQRKNETRATMTASQNTPRTPQVSHGAGFGPEGRSAFSFGGSASSDIALPWSSTPPTSRHPNYLSDHAQDTAAPAGRQLPFGMAALARAGPCPVPAQGPSRASAAPRLERVASSPGPRYDRAEPPCA